MQTTEDLVAAASSRNGYQVRDPEHINYAAVISSLLKRYVVMIDEQYLVVALWVIHTYLADSIEQTPYLAISSPEPECGKSLLIEVLELMVNNPFNVILPSEATLFRTIDEYNPTVLLDETDAIFAPKTAQYHEGLRAAINAGHRKGAKVPRCAGPNHEIQKFNVYCPKVLAGIGSLPDTIAGRSIPIRLQRKRKDEAVERFRRRIAAPEIEELAKGWAVWADEWAATVGEAMPEMPDELSDRMQDGCEPLVAIADLLGCGEEARAALVSILTDDTTSSHESVRLQLLRDTREVFGLEKFKDEPAGLHTGVLCFELRMLEDSPWATWYGRGIEANDLAALLGEYGIHSGSVRMKATGIVAKGYKRDSFHEAWSRYL